MTEVNYEPESSPSIRTAEAINVEAVFLESGNLKVAIDPATCAIIGLIFKIGNDHSYNAVPQIEGKSPAPIVTTPNLPVSRPWQIDQQTAYAVQLSRELLVANRPCLQIVEVSLSENFVKVKVLQDRELFNTAFLNRVLLKAGDSQFPSEDTIILSSHRVQFGGYNTQAGTRYKQRLIFGGDEEENLIGYLKHPEEIFVVGVYTNCRVAEVKMYSEGSALYPVLPISEQNIIPTVWYRFNAPEARGT